MRESPDYWCCRIDAMKNLHNPLAVLAARVPRAQFEREPATMFGGGERAGRVIDWADLLRLRSELAVAVPCNAGRQRLAIRLMCSLLYLKHGCSFCDQEACLRWSQDVLRQFFSGQTYYEHRQTCEATQISRFRRELAEGGLEQLLKGSVYTAEAVKAVHLREFQCLIVRTVAPAKAIGRPLDRRPLEIARHKGVSARHARIALSQKYGKEGNAKPSQSQGCSDANADLRHGSHGLTWPKCICKADSLTSQNRTDP
jgi:transposase, IS5 family